MQTLGKNHFMEWIPTQLLLRKGLGEEQFFCRHSNDFEESLCETFSDVATS